MITRDNYEEFFLLYTDNELSAAQKDEVERFVAQHPDLQEEWDALLQCRLSPESGISFPGKDLLRRQEVEGHRYTDHFLSYIDGEGNAGDREAVEDMLRQHPQHRAAFDLLRKTISQPDTTIVFPEKQLLYRKEKDRRIIALPRVRAGIAAVLAGAVALLFLLSGPHHPIAQPDSSGIAATSPAPIAGQAAAASGGTTRPGATVTPGATIASGGATLPAKTTAPDRKIVVPVTRATVAALYSGKATPANKKSDPKKSGPAPLLNGNEYTKESGTALAKTADPDKGLRSIDPATMVPTHDLPADRDMASNVHLAVQTRIPKEQSSFATQALMEEANDEKNNNFVTDESPAPGKSKLRGIFRRMTRTFEKTADRDKDGNRQVLVGAFQFAVN